MRLDLAALVEHASPKLPEDPEIANCSLQELHAVFAILEFTAQVQLVLDWASVGNHSQVTSYKERLATHAFLVLAALEELVWVEL